MAFVSLKRDTDTAIQESSFSDGQVAVAYDTNSIYVDVLTKDNQQERVKIDGNAPGSTMVVSNTTPTGTYSSKDVWFITTDI